MFVCEYEFKSEDMVAGTVATMKAQPQKVQKVLLWIMPFVILAYSVVLVVDIIQGVDIMMDILLLVVMVSTYITLWCLPKVYKSIAKKTYQSNALANQTCNVYMDESECVVSFSKEGKELSRETLNWSSMTGYTQDEQYIVLVFGTKFVVLKKDFLRGEHDLLLLMLDKYLADNIQKQQQL